MGRGERWVEMAVLVIDEMIFIFAAFDGYYKYKTMADKGDLEGLLVGGRFLDVVWMWGGFNNNLSF